MRSDASASGVLIVDLDALARNYAVLRRAVAPSECGAVVKANAYGLGVAPVARRLAREGCSSYFVATLAEGQELRALLSAARIFVLEGAVAGAETALAAAKLVPVLNSLEQIERWSASGGPAALQVDTGMTRLGLSPAEVATLAAEPRRLRNIEIEYVMTHLACADEPEHSLNAQQLKLFDRLRSRLPRAKTSIGNSAGAFLSEAHRGDLVRAGIALYGGNPFIAPPSPVEAVVAVKARIVQVRALEETAVVGYGATYVLEAPARVAVIGVGYADGYPRSLGNAGSACVAGMRVPIVGRISMDLICLDVSRVPAERVREGMYVDLIGGGIELDEVAALAGTISYEVLTRLGPRLKREYRGEGSKA